MWPARPADVRFAEKHVPIPDAGCWLWTAAVDGKGYGAFRMEKMEQAHRASWLLHHGPIPDGMCVCHKCDTPLCVNPSHLFLGTNLDNMRDRDRKGRAAKRDGEKCGTSKLTEADVMAIRVAGGLHREIAASFGVSRETVGEIRRGVTWKHVA